MTTPRDAQVSGGAPLDLDSSRASIARVYDGALGGTDNFEIDREVLAQVREVAPEVNDLAWSNRRFLARAVRFLGDQGGIRQYLDCGSGLPTAENTHQIARRIDPATRVVYVDNDAAVIAHSQALLAGDELSPLARRMEQVFLHSPMRSGIFRTRAQIEAFLPGLEIVPPGPGRPGELELCDLWWPDGPKLRPLNQVERCIAAAIGRKP